MFLQQTKVRTVACAKAEAVWHTTKAGEQIYLKIFLWISPLSYARSCDLLWPSSQCRRCLQKQHFSFTKPAWVNVKSFFSTATSRRGLDTRNVQAATTVSPQASTNNIPIHRQLATISNPDQSRLIRSLNLRRESHRFQTFTAEWPSDSAPPAEDMATSGWF